MLLTCNSQTCLLLEGKPSPTGGSHGVGGHILTIRPFRSQGCKAQGSWLLLLSTAPLPSSSHSLCCFSCFFFFLIFAASLSFGVHLALLPVSLSESELSESDDFLSLYFFFFFPFFLFLEFFVGSGFSHSADVAFPSHLHQRVFGPPWLYDTILCKVAFTVTLLAGSVRDSLEGDLLSAQRNLGRTTSASLLAP